MNPEDQQLIGWAGIFIAILCCGLIGLAVGRTRGREFAGFMLGLLLGPLGICIAIALQDNRRKCIFCRFSIPNEAIACGNCGRDLV